MIIKANKKSYFIFDLDDTLYSEIDFLKSAFRYIALDADPQSPEILYQTMLDIYVSEQDVFDYIVHTFPSRHYTKDYLINLYRSHNPEISLRQGVSDLLLKIKSKDAKIGLITNGRSITQKNKINALGIEKFLDKILISEEFGFEKPNEEVYRNFLNPDEINQYFYFGDNLDIDFISPKKLGWLCIGIHNNNNIRDIDISRFSYEYQPHFFIENFTEIKIV